MTNFILIALCLSAGWLLRRSRILEQGAEAGINTWLIWIAIPATALKYVPHIKWSTALLLPALMPFVVWTVAVIFFRSCARRMHFDSATRTALTLTAGLGNTSFVGFPLVQAFYGGQAMPIAVVCDQASFIVMSTLGAIAAIRATKGATVSPLALTVKLFSFPPFLAFLAALLLPLWLDISSIFPLCDTLSGTLVPLALFTVGMQLSFKGWRQALPFLGIGLAYKLLLAPAIIALLALALHQKGLTAQVSVLEASMAPMVTAGLIAAQYGLKPDLANLMIGVGILLSFLSIPVWWLALHLFN